MLLIVGRHEDPHILQILPLLKDRHLRVLRFNPSDFPADASLSLKLGSSQQMTAILSFPSCEIDGEFIETVEIDIREIDLVWNRVRSRSQAPAEVNKCHRLWVEENCTRQLAYLYELIRCPWIPYRPDSCHAQFTREAATPVSVLSGQRYARVIEGLRQKIIYQYCSSTTRFSSRNSTEVAAGSLDFYRYAILLAKTCRSCHVLDGVP